MNIQKAEMDDLPAIIAIYKSAQDFMIKTGNPTQWGHSYPTRDLVKKDICKRICYLICDDDSPHGVFALFNKAEPTYQYIENGNWLNEDEYITLTGIWIEFCCSTRFFKASQVYRFLKTILNLSY
jgi:hypothetical protein